MKVFTMLASIPNVSGRGTIAGKFLMGYSIANPTVPTWL